jgi:hypothetical protein
MTPEEKAKELIDKYEGVDDCDKHYYERYSPCSHQAKQCAIICAEQIIQVAWWSSTDEMPEPYRLSQKEYWMQVLEHIKQQ